MSQRSALARLACALALVLTFPLAADEWTPTRAFRMFSKTTWRGLPQSSVISLAQDRDGLLWIGTLDGAATFDGKSIDPVAAVAGAPQHGVISAIVARRSGGVYVGSPAGVHAFDGESWHLIASKKAVVALAESTDGTLWMADSEGKLWTRGGTSWQRHGETGAPVVALAAAGDGSIYAATEHNAFRIRNGAAEAVGGPLAARPGAILVAHDGRVWVATIAGTVHWTSGADPWHQAAFQPWPHGTFRSLAEDRRGRIWVGTTGGGIAFGNADMPWTVWNGRNGPFTGGAMTVLGDDEGNVWFGLNALGLAQWVGEEWSHRATLDPNVPAASPTFGGFGLAPGAEPHSLLVAVFEKGFLRLTASGSRLYGAADGLTQDVRVAVEPEPGFFIAGTRFGIFEAKPGQTFRQVFTLPGGFVTGLFRAPDGRWFAASTNGVLIRENGTWVPAAAMNAQLEDATVRNITWRSNGEMWVGTMRGITVFRGNAAERITARRVPALPESVNAIVESGADVWAGGTGGIAVLHNGRWTRMADADGVPGQTIYSLRRAPDGAIWAGGSAGVGRFANGRWRTWDTREGLINEECNLNGLQIEDDGTVYVGSLGGLARFDPTVKPLSVPPLKLAWKSTQLRDRALHLRWSAPWLGTHPVQFRVRIPRLRDVWSAPSSDDHIDVENLAAGDWRVEVQARVEGGAWSDAIRLDTHVPPFWYETTAARVAGVALLAAILYLIVRLRMAALRRHAAMLEAVVHARTAELAEKVEQLRDSEQRALAASRAKSAFLANMSHELRTPLNGVLGFAQLLTRRKDRDAEDREGLAVIMKSGEHLLNLINDVLSLSKIEAGRVTLDKAPFALDVLVHDVENVVRFRADEKGIHLTCTLGAGAPPAVIGDEGKLRQILINLLGNAVKFTERGSVSLEASWRDGRAVFAVRDTGPGIAAADLPRLFEPFVQTETAQRVKEGTGLGLALSRDLARLMDGDITVLSEPGRGSTFRVEVALPPAAAAALVTAKESRRVASLAPGQPPVRVLVVDDTPLNRTVLSRLLESVGFHVRTADNGEEAIAAWESWQPHFIWMDKRMKGVDGLEATRRIRAREAAEGRQLVPIVALSASALEHERGEILAAGCDDFVAKPFRESLIFAKMREFLGVEYVYEDIAAGAARARVATDAAGVRGSVLLVDDDWICREVAQELLTGCGVRVTTASNGAEALDLVAKSDFDMVLMDLRMPGMDGVETMRRIRAIAGKDRLPIIAMSADAADTPHGLDDAIPKPVAPAAIEAALDKWLPR